MTQRLSKILAWSGVASRRQCEEIIAQGRVRVNGQIVKVPQTMVDPEKDRLEVDGERVRGVSEKRYYILHKPKGYLCSNKREDERDKLAIDLINDDRRLFTVGRLDKDTSGLIIVTNDGHYAHEVIHPSSNIDKEYIAQLDREATADDLKKISKGTVVEGVHVKPKKVVKMRRNQLKVIVTDGRKREVRLLIAAAGLDCINLARTRIGNLRLGNLPIGRYRVMGETERLAIFE